MARVLLLTGGARSDREHAIDALAADQWGRSLLVVPTRHEAGERAARIIQSFNLAGSWDDCVLAFEDFALRLLREAGDFPHEIDDVDRRVLIGSTLDRLNADGKLGALGDAAGSPGFANHILRVITKLKQAAVEPSEFRAVVARRERGSWLDAIVAEVYEAYQATLHSAKAYDRVGVYWRANVILRGQTPPLFARARHVFFDEFDDFTPSEFRVIEQTIRHVDTLAFGVACNPDAASQRDLYAVPLKTLERLQRAFSGLETRSFPEPPPTNRTEFVTTQLFWRDKPAPPRGIDENLTLQPCHDRMHECEWIGRAIKTLIVERGIDPARIAVVYRGLNNSAARLRVVFDEFQIPAKFHAPRSLIDSMFARYLLRLLNVLPDWDREAVVDALASKWSGASEEYKGAYGYLARAAGVIEGRREWEACAQRLRAWLAEGSGEQHDETLRRVPNADSALDTLLEDIAVLTKRLRLLPAKGTRAEYADATMALIADLRPEAILTALDDERIRRFEEHALAVLFAVLRRMRAWGKSLPGTAPMSLSDFQAELRDAFTDSAVDEDGPGAGVQVMSAEAARFRTYDYLFLGGLNEGEFPAPPAIDAVYSDEDWRDLERAGAPVELRGRQMDREMVLFHHVLARAQAGAFLTWCAAGHDGRPLAPSPFIDDVKDLMDTNGTPIPQTTTFLPELEHAASTRDLRNASGATRDVERAFADTFACIHAGLAVETDRNSPAAFGVYDGTLSDRELLAQLASAYGPGHSFSAAQLESYAECPFQFYLERILRVDAIETPDEEFDPRVRGRILHEVLHEFHATFRGAPLGAVPPAAARETMTRLCAEVFDRHARREVTAPRGVVRAERARMEAQLLRYLDLSREEEAPWAPSHFEVGFGRAHANSEDSLSKPDPFLLETDDGTVLLSGRIDRVDLKDGKARIVDYKTTIRYAAKDVTDGVSLQMPLYAAALEGLLMPGMECAEAKLVQPGKDDDKEVLQRERGKWPEREAGMKRGIARAVAGIRAGQFPPGPHRDRCHVCAGSRVCRFEQWRIDRKVNDDDAPDA